jgi:hypothetical protein
VCRRRIWLALASACAAALCLAGSAAGTQDETSTSTNWSGYTLAGGPFTVTTAVFNVPNLTAAPTATSTSEWVGVDGADPTDRSLIQAGVRETYNPHTNRVELYVWWEILPALEQPIRLPIAVGDRIRVTITRLAGARWQIEVANLTEGGRFVTTRRYDGPGRTVDFIVEAPADRHGRIGTLGHYVPDVTFGDLRATGRRGALHAMTMVQGGVAVSQVSHLAPHGFSVSYG